MKLFYYFENGVVMREGDVDGGGGTLEEIQRGFSFIHEGVEFFGMGEEAGGDQCAEAFENSGAREVGPNLVFDALVASEAIEVYGGTGVESFLVSGVGLVVVHAVEEVVFCFNDETITLKIIFAMSKGDEPGECGFGFRHRTYYSPFVFCWVCGDELERKVGVVFVRMRFGIFSVFLLSEGVHREGVGGLSANKMSVYAVKVSLWLTGAADFAPFAFAVDFPEFVADGFEVIRIGIGIFWNEAEVFERTINLVRKMVLWSRLRRYGARVRGEICERDTVSARKKKETPFVIGTRVGNLSEAVRIEVYFFAVGRKYPSVLFDD